MATNKYTKNRNLWRKVIGYGDAQPRPVIETFVDPLTSIEYSLNLQETLRHRDLFQVPKPNIDNDSVTYGEYDEGIVSYVMTDSVYKDFNFGITFTNNPIVVLTIDQNETNTTNVIPYGITFSTTGAYVGISAPFSGNLRYRAIYNATYPTQVISAFTGSIIVASAGTITVSSNSVSYSTTFDALSSIPTEIYQTAWDTTDNSSDVYLSGTNVTISTLEASISAPYSKDIHFILIE